MKIEIKNFDELEDFLTRQMNTFEDAWTKLDIDCLIPALNPKNLKIQIERWEPIKLGRPNRLSILFAEKYSLADDEESLDVRVEFLDIDEETRQLIPKTLEVSEEIYRRLYED